MTLPTGEGRSLFNLVVRGLAFRNGHLLVSRWVGDYCFPIGGRLTHGEALDDAVRREFLEETGVPASIVKLVYLHEHFFVARDGWDVHELGWYFWVEPTAPVGELDEVWPHPDHPDLRLAYVRLDRLEESQLLPSFLVEALPRDVPEGFPGPLRRILSREAE